MNRRLIALLSAAPALALALAPSSALAHNGHHGHDHHGRHHGHTVFRSHLVPATPTDAPINGVNPGAVPWVIDRGEVRVRANGRLDVRIDGLQVARADGTTDNPIASVDAVVYSDGVMVADSGPEPLSVPDGDAHFRAFVPMPRHLHHVSVLISPSTAVGTAFIASATGR